MTRPWLAAAIALAGVLLPMAPAAGAARVPAFEGPVTGGIRGFAWNEWPWPMPDGWRQDEYFMTGVATSFVSDLPKAIYRTRIQVFRPIDPDDFDGTVFIDWNNVTGQIEVNPDAWWAHPQVFRDGSVLVMASVQETGNCGTSLPNALPDENGHPIQFGICNPLGLRGWDPVRYAPLDHPGDDYMWDLFSQVLDGIRSSSGIDPYDGLHVERVIAMGQSQSAQQLDKWLCNGAARSADAVLIHSDWGRRVPCDPPVPTLLLETEESARPAEATVGGNLRIWQVPGAPHEDFWILTLAGAIIGHNETGQVSQDYAATFDTAGNYGEAGVLAPGVCVPEGNMYPTRYAVDAALAALVSWVSGGPPPATLPPMEFVGDQFILSPTAQFTPNSAYAKDADGNTLGGMRSPVLDRPIATYRGGTDPCPLLGTTSPLSDARLAELYASHADYVQQIHASAEQAIHEGRLMPADAEDLLFRACRSTIGGADVVDCPPITAFSPYVIGRPGAGEPPTSSPGDPLPVTGGGLPLVAALTIALGLASRTRK